MIAKNEYGIAKWKIDSKEERQLACLADDSPEGKSVYVEYYRVNDAEYYAAGLPMIERELKRFNVKEQGQDRKAIIDDMIYSHHRFGFSFAEYFQLKLKDKSAAERAEYVAIKKSYEYCQRLNSAEGIEVLRNKAATLERLKPYIKRDYMTVFSGGGSHG